MKATERIVACFLLFGACLVWPLLSIANRPVLIFGVPALVLYLFGVWGAIVAVLILEARRRAPGGRRLMSLSQGSLLGVVLGYLVFLFVVATAAEAGSKWLTRGALADPHLRAGRRPCTARRGPSTAASGLAANRGLEFLTIYLGPACIALLWPVLLRKLVRVAKEQRITSISDFISSRYGKSAPLGMLVALLVVCGMIPYIALQLKAVSVSFTMILREESVLDIFDPTLLVAATLALFGILFGARNLDFTKQQTGLMTAVAVESIVKLVAFLLVGVYVTWGLFGGFADIFGRAAAHPIGRACSPSTSPPPRPTRAGRPCS